MNFISDLKGNSDNLYKEIHNQIEKIKVVLESELVYEKQKQEKYKDKFLGIFLNPGIKKRIKMIEDYQVKINVFFPPISTKKTYKSIKTLDPINLK